MAATQTVAQTFPLRKPTHDTADLKPRNGVITLSGYGIDVRVERGHLLLEDGIGPDRTQLRLPRVGHGLKRLVVIGSDGSVSLAALRWLADQDVSFSMLERDGSVLATTGPVRSSDVRLRRAQALALQNGTALRISRELVDRKLSGQQKVAMEKLEDESTATAIRCLRSGLAEAETLAAVRQIEAHAAKAYWASWRKLAIVFPRKDLPRVPEHWRKFEARASLLSNGPRLATDPVNAILNYLYAVLESEVGLAAATLGLDLGMGVLHLDTAYRESLTFDLMEPIRPNVDEFVLDWLRREPLPRNSFFEQRNGNCRLMAPLAIRLSQTAPIWARLIAPVAEWFAHELSKSTNIRPGSLPARLTERNRRTAKSEELQPQRKAFKFQRLCQGCGKILTIDSINCADCSKDIDSERMPKVAAIGRVASHSPEAAAKRAATQRINIKAVWDWKPSNNPAWLTEQFYSESVQPKLSAIPSSAIVKLLNVTVGYAGNIRKGRVPHPRHWYALAKFVEQRKSL